MASMFDSKHFEPYNTQYNRSDHFRSLPLILSVIVIKTPEVVIELNCLMKKQYFPENGHNDLAEFSAKSHC